MKAIFFLLAPFMAFASAMIDLRVSVDPINGANSHVDLFAQKAFDLGPCSLLLNPSISAHLNGTADYSISGGHRWDIGASAVGHHVFFDRSIFRGFPVNQLGTGVDVITEIADFRVNYYHPLTNTLFSRRGLHVPCTWVETEMLIKTPFFSVGGGGPRLTSRLVDLGRSLRRLSLSKVLAWAPAVPWIQGDSDRFPY